MKKIISIVAITLLLSVGAANAMQPPANACGNHGNNCVVGEGSATTNNTTTTNTNTYDVDVSRSGILSGNNGDVLSNNTLNSNNTTVSRGGRLVEGDVNNGGSSRQGQAQGQGQQQGQTQSGTVTGSIDGNSSSIGDITVNTFDPNGGDRDLTPPTVDSNNVSYDSFYEAQDRNPVSSAFAAPLVATEDTCMGSSSAAGQGITFGLSLATTWSDADCVIRKDARLFHNVGQDSIALSLMCQKPDVRAAIARAGDSAQLALCDINAADARWVGDLDGNDKNPDDGQSGYDLD